MTKVFISYRREDTTAGFAALIHTRLAETLGRDVFMDVDNLPLGVDWEEHIHAALRDCDVALVLIGKLWLNATGADDQRRLDDPTDVLRLEIAEVLSRPTVRVIPVLFGPVNMPKRDELPDNIRALAAKQSFFWHLDQSSASQLQKIDEAVRLGPMVALRQPGSDRAARSTPDRGPQIGGALSARVLALCAELLDEISDAAGREAIAAIQRSLQRSSSGPGWLLADAAQADRALEALDTLSWSQPELRFVRDRVEDLRDGPDMQMIDLAKWYDRSAAGEVDLPHDKRDELGRLLTAASSAERLGLGSRATAREVREAAGGRVLAWRRFEAGSLASPMAQRVAGDVVRFYEELAVQTDPDAT